MLYDPDVLVGRLLAGAFDEFVQHGVERSRLHPDLLLARKVEQCGHDLFGPARFLDNHVHIFPALGILRQVLEYDVRKEQDRAQRVVQLVGDSGRQLSHRGQPFLADQLRLGLFQFGDHAVKSLAQDSHFSHTLGWNAHLGVASSDLAAGPRHLFQGVSDQVRDGQRQQCGRDDGHQRHEYDAVPECAL